MFYISKLKDHVKIRSKQVNANIVKNIEEELRTVYENKILGRINGYIINIFKMNDDIEKGTLDDITGDVSYYVEYYVSVFIPKIKNVLEIVVNSIDGDVCGYPALIPEIEKNNSIVCICKKDLNPLFSNKKPLSHEGIEIGSRINMYIVNVDVRYHRIVMIGYIV